MRGVSARPPLVHLEDSQGPGHVGERIDLCAHFLLQPSEDAFDLGLLLLVEIRHLPGQEGQEVVDRVWLLALGVLGQAGFGAGEDLFETVGGVEVLELGCQGGVFGFGGGDGDATDGVFR